MEAIQEVTLGTKDEKALTTGQIAKICKVAPRTVSLWFDSGRLKGYRLPCGRDRRVLLSDFVAFAKENNLPISINTRWFLGIGLSVMQWGMLKSQLPMVNMVLAESAFDAGYNVKNNRPTGVVIDTIIGSADAHACAARLRSHFPDLPIIFVVGEDVDPATVDQSNISQIMQHPFKIEEMAQAIVAM